MNFIERWMSRRGAIPPPHDDVLSAYQRLFTSPDGQVVMQHLLDNIFCLVYEGTDVQETVIHNARRTVVMEILQNSTIIGDSVRSDVLDTLNQQESHATR